MPQELRITHISGNHFVNFNKLCPNVPWVILFQSYVRYVWGPKKGSRDLFFVLWNLMISWIVFILHRKIFPIHHTCMSCLFFSFLLIYKTRPNDFDLQLGCCISDAFSIFQLYYGKNKLYSMKWWWCPLCSRPTNTLSWIFIVLSHWNSL